MPKKGYTVMTGIKRHTFAGLLTAGLLTGITAIVTAAELTSLERMERAAGAEAFRKAMAAKEKDNAAYLNNLRIAVDKGTPAAILEDADRLLLRAGGRVNNYDMIRQRLERLSRQTPDSDYFTETQLAEVRYFLGVANEHGMGSAIDRISATRNYLLAAHLNMDARIALGRLFFFQDTVLHGEKTKEIDAVALMLYSVCLNAPEKEQKVLSSQDLIRKFDNTLTILAENGDTQAMFFLARHYLEGTHFPTRKTKGISYLTTAAEKMNPEAALMLGNIYQNGLYSQKANAVKAKKFFEQAFSQKKTSSAAAENLAKIAETNKQDSTAVRYYLYLKDYDNAARVLAQRDGEKISANAVFVQAMRYKKQPGYNKDEYMRQLNMAANGGSLYAHIELNSGQNIKNLFRAMSNLKFKPQEPDWNYRLALVALRGIRTGATTAEQALQALDQGVKNNEVQAAAALLKAYRNGAPLLRVAKDDKKVAELTEKILAIDYNGSQDEVWNSVNNDINALLKVAAVNSHALRVLAQETTNPKAKILLHAMAGSPELQKLLDSQYAVPEKRVGSTK